VAAGETADDSVNVSSYDRLETIEPPAPVSLAAQFSDALTQWGGPAGLTLFALWALFMLNRSVQRTNRSQAATAAKSPAGNATATSTDAANEDDDLNREPTKRDRLQTLVKDNPEMAATVISRWLTPPK
jgi:flagellar M-ring protein FliF